MPRIPNLKQRKELLMNAPVKPNTKYIDVWWYVEELPNWRKGMGKKQLADLIETSKSELVETLKAREGLTGVQATKGVNNLSKQIKETGLAIPVEVD